MNPVPQRSQALSSVHCHPLKPPNLRAHEPQLEKAACPQLQKLTGHSEDPVQPKLTSHLAPQRRADSLGPSPGLIWLSALTPTALYPRGCKCLEGLSHLSTSLHSCWQGPVSSGVHLVGSFLERLWTTEIGLPTVPSPPWGPRALQSLFLLGLWNPPLFPKSLLQENRPHAFHFSSYNWTLNALIILAIHPECVVICC